ncbi:nitrilase 1 S homeolog isoform X2 [Xenopus laevis]|uniref:Nitrilase 1 S homeolog isoform X2 n=1 Tax=Xenopus laevis TaxID=8355 RepID=A0A8J1LMW9_XENLA|nr:nitrilase 1 S homeolog isoform X2 [Xenopus laevis]
MTGSAWLLVGRVSRVIVGPWVRSLSAMAGAHKPLIAVCQMTSTSDKEKNFATCSRLIREAAGRRACMVFLPEAFDYIGGSIEETLSLAESLHGDTIQRYTQLARECGLWLSLGGFHEKGPNWDTDQRISNSHVVVDNTGHIVSVYRKAHLFDVDLQNGVSLRESSSTLPGAELIRPITSPAGKVLLRARAIETQCYVVAAAQTDRHNEKRTSYGHAMVVDPWGLVIGQCQEGTGICYAEIDIPYMERVRRDMPVWRHRRTDLYGKISFNKPD